MAKLIKATLARRDSDNISLTRQIKEGVAKACSLLDRDDDDIKEKCVSALVSAAVRAVSFMTIARHLNKTTRCACTLCAGSSALWSALICLSEVDSGFVDDLLRNTYRPRLTRTAFFGDLVSSAAGSWNSNLLYQVATSWQGYPDHLQVEMRGVRLATALLLAESKDNFDAVRLLLSQHPSIVNSDIYLLAITQAFQHNHTGIACHLVRQQQFMEWNPRSKRHRFLLRAAAQLPNEGPLRLMLDHPDAAVLSAWLNAPLEDACRLGRLDSVRLLLSKACPASLTEYSGATYWAARSGNVDILRLLSTETDCLLRPRAVLSALVGASFDKTETLNYIICQWLHLEPASFPEMGLGAYVKACGLFSCNFDIVRQRSCVCSPSDMHEPLREDEARLAIRDVARPMPALGPDSSSVHAEHKELQHFLLVNACLDGDLGFLVRALPGLSDNTLNNDTFANYCSTALQRGDYGIALYLIIARKLDLPTLTACMLSSTVVFQIFLDLGWDIDASFEGYGVGTGSPLL